MIIKSDQKYSVCSLDFFLKNYTTYICVGLDKCQTNKQTNSEKATIYQMILFDILNSIYFSNRKLDTLKSTFLLIPMRSHERTS